MSPEVMTQFQTLVKKGPTHECWGWGGKHDDQGYGLFWPGGERYAHRVAWRVAHKGRAIPKGWCVRHRCDNKGCVNPDHLVVGTHLDNVRDAVERGLLRRGSSKRPDVTELMVYEARCDVLVTRKARLKALVKEWKMPASQVSDIINGRLWRHVPMPDGYTHLPRRRPLKIGQSDERL